MVSPEHLCVGTFHATYAVLKAEKILKNLGIPAIMIPVPRQISSNCGIAIKFALTEIERVREAINPFSEDLEGFFRLDNDGRYTRI